LAGYIGVSATCIGLVIGLSVNNQSEISKAFISILPIMLGTFFGAWFAFRFQNKREETKKDEQRVEALHRALFLLGRFINELEVIKKQTIDPYRGREDIWLTMLPTLIPEYNDFKFEINNLSFILSTDSPNTLHDLLIEESRFHQAIIAINYRSKLHLEQVQPILMEKGFDPDRPNNIQDYENALGLFVTASIKKGTEEAMYAVDKALKTSQELMKDLSEKTKQWYPNYKSLIIDI